MNLDFLTIDVGTILFTLINTFIIFLVFKHLLFKRVDDILEKRRQEVTTTYQEADTALASAKADQEKYTAALAGAKEEAAQIRTRAEQRARQQSDNILEDARREAQAAREKAMQDTEREKEQARTELKGEISDLALELAQRIMEKEINKEDHERLIGDFLQEIDTAGEGGKA